MKRFFWAALCFACGCGGGGSSDGVSLRFTPSRVDLVVYEGDPTPFQLRAESSDYIGDPLQVVDRDGGFEPIDAIGPEREGVFVARLQVRRTLPVGVRSGRLQVRLCRDSPVTCDDPYPGSPWSIPYRIEVREGTNLTPLSPLPEATAWSTYQGNAAHTAYVPAPTLDAASFTRRWGRDGEVRGMAADGGRLFVVTHDEGRWALRAIREEDGVELWVHDFGEIEAIDPPATGNGRVFLASNDFDDTALWVFDQASGALLRHHPLVHRGTHFGAPVVHGSKVYLTYSDVGLLHFDATTLSFRPVLREPMRVERSFSLPERISCDAISVVIPVKNNQEGIDRFLSSVASNLEPSGRPREIIIVDNNSDVMTSARVECPVPVKVLSCTRRGPGAARNDGVAHATGEWILFTDSDCMATPSLVSGYVTDQVTAVAYAGNVDTRVVDQCSIYYQEMNIFIAPPLATPAGVIPATLVTANSLVLKDAFLAIGGFNERFVYAGCEDSDLGYRLSMVGDLMYNLNSVAAHEITDGIQGFIERFMRYGRGTRLLDVHYNNPGLFVPQRPGMLAEKTPSIRYLAQIQYHAMWWGYLAEKFPEYLVLPEAPQS